MEFVTCLLTNAPVGGKLLAFGPLVDLVSDALYLRQCHVYQTGHWVEGEVPCPFMLDKTGKLMMGAMMGTIGFGVLADMTSAYYRYQQSEGESMAEWGLGQARELEQERADIEAQAYAEMAEADGKELKKKKQRKKREREQEQRREELQAAQEEYETRLKDREDTQSVFNRTTWHTMKMRAIVGIAVLLIEDVTQLSMTYYIEYEKRPGALQDCGLPDEPVNTIGLYSIYITAVMMTIRLVVASHTWYDNAGF
jgi:hypothetical protein